MTTKSRNKATPRNKEIGLITLLHDESLSDPYAFLTKKTATASMKHVGFSYLVIKKNNYCHNNVLLSYLDILKRPTTSSFK